MTVQYDRHDDEWIACLADEKRRRTAETWLRSDTMDEWRHSRLRAPILPVIKSDPDASWLTVGDGRFGSDARWLMANGAARVHASDISDRLLTSDLVAHLLPEASAQNAEDLQFPDGAFDYLLCKEALHHMPRPGVALHEMMRVAKKAVILIEPRDKVIEPAPLAVIRRFLTSRPRHDFEPVGNYVYSVSEREIEKFQLAMHRRHVAFLGLSDHYAAGSEFTAQAGGTTSEKAMRARLKAHIFAQTVASRMGIIAPGLILAVLFKEPPPARVTDAMIADGWRVRELPKNPYL